MTIELFLQVVFQIGVAIAFTALISAGVAVSIYYSWKSAEGLIKKREKILGKVKSSRWLKKESPALRMVKAERKAKG